MANNPKIITSAKTLVLDESYHEALVRNKDHYCQVAGIPPVTLTLSAEGVVPPEILDWLRDYKKHTEASRNLVVQCNQSYALGWCQLITAFFLRNYKDARIVPYASYESACTASDPVEGSIVLIPDMVVPEGSVASWVSNKMVAEFSRRAVYNQISVCFTDNVQGLRKACRPVHDYLMNTSAVYLDKD